MKALGLHIQLGHPPGIPCILPEKAFNDNFTIIGDHDLHNVTLDFCNCTTAQSHATQLLRFGLYPATVDDPRTATLFRVLERFHLLSFKSKVSAFEFYQSLVWETDNTASYLVKVSHFDYRMSKWLNKESRIVTLSSCRWFVNGGTLSCSREVAMVMIPLELRPPNQANLPLSALHALSLGVIFLNNGNWFLIISSEYSSSLLCLQTDSMNNRWLYRLFLGIDGNFWLKRKAVSNDEDNPSLGPGWSYFIERKAFQDHLEHAATPMEVGRQLPINSCY